jgi:hypothetical protein
MIPKFPQFKKLEIDDRIDAEKFTCDFLPYSDFNFTSLWCWNTHGQIRISELNNNLVIRFADYLTGQHFYSFLGKIKVNETIEELLSLSSREDLKMELKLIPADIINYIDHKTYSITEEPEHFDYIYDVKNLIDMDGHDLKIKRKHSRFFEKNFPHQIKMLNLNDPLVKKELIDIFDLWATDKGINISEYYKNEFNAFLRLLDFSELFSSIVIGIYIEGKLSAFSITENTNHGYNLGHFQKARGYSFKGINDYMVNKLASFLKEQNITHMNCEQDLGIPGLRESKQSYRPSNYLKKYSLSFINTSN